MECRAPWNFDRRQMEPPMDPKGIFRFTFAPGDHALAVPMLGCISFGLANGILSYDSAQMYTGEELRHMMAQMLEAGRTGKYVRVYYDDMITTMSSSVYQARWAVF